MQSELLAHVLGEPRDLHPARPRHVGISGNGGSRLGHLAQLGHASQERRPQVGVCHRPVRRLAFLEAPGCHRLPGQMAAEDPGQFLSIASLVHHDVTDGPRVTPGARIWAPVLDGMCERSPLGELINVTSLRTVQPPGSRSAATLSDRCFDDDRSEVWTFTSRFT